MTNLFINYYTDKNHARNQELELCVLSNMLNSNIDKLVIVLGKKEVKPLQQLIDKTNCKKCEMVIYEDRPTLNYFFSLTTPFVNDINIIANTDIVLDETSLEILKNWEFKNRVLALSRWDFVNMQLSAATSTLFNRPDSQDTWIKKGSFPITEGADICLGKAGVDNKIAYLLDKQFEVINPSLTIKTFHLHLTNIRNYFDGAGIVVDRIPPPYKLIWPTDLPE